MPVKNQVLEEAVALCERRPIQTVAKALAKEHPQFWSSVDSARSALRLKLGAMGNESRKAGVDKRSTIAEGLAKLNAAPKPETKDITLTGSTLVISDIHLPFHDPEALEVAITHGADADHVLINGDLLDFYQISRFLREPSEAGIEREVLEAQKFFEALRSVFSGRIVWKIGNHEERLRTYILRQAKELSALDALTLESLCRCEEYGVETVGREIVKVGKLNVAHGHEFGESIFSPVNPARGVFLRAKCSTMVGHHHQTSDHAEGNLNGDAMGCWSTGCLCSLQPDYRPFAFTKWNHGFALVDSDSDGSFEVRNHRIIRGRVF